MLCVKFNPLKPIEVVIIEGVLHKKWMKTHLFYMALQGLSLWEAVLPLSSQWRHNECDGFSNHRRLDCLLNPFSKRWSKNIKAPRQTASNAENVSIW